MKRIWVVLLCLAMLGSSAGFAADKGDAKKPLIVKAWRKTGKPSDHETRILSHLEGFKKDEAVKLNAYGGWISEKVKATGFFCYAPVPVVDLTQQLRICPTNRAP